MYLQQRLVIVSRHYLSLDGIKSVRGLAKAKTMICVKIFSVQSSISLKKMK